MRPHHRMFPAEPRSRRRAVDESEGIEVAYGAHPNIVSDVGGGAWDRASADPQMAGRHAAGSRESHLGNAGLVLRPGRGPRAWAAEPAGDTRAGCAAGDWGG